MEADESPQSQTTPPPPPPGGKGKILYVCIYQKHLNKFKKRGVGGDEKILFKADIFY